MNHHRTDPGDKDWPSAVLPWYSETAWVLMGLGFPEGIGSNPDYGLSGDQASTRGNGSQVGGLSYRRSPLGGLL